MCGVLVTWWVGRHNNGPIDETSNSNLRGSAVNTRVVKLEPLRTNPDELGERGGREASGDDKNGTDQTTNAGKADERPA
ncbi:hypothetical protein B7463_g3887, partial [Scytalidium lignicola]